MIKHLTAEFKKQA